MEINLLKKQWEVLNSEHKYTLLLAGIGFGKTFTGVHWVIKKIKTSPKSLGFIGATTYSQLRNSTMACVFNELSRLEVPFSYNQSTGILSIQKKKFLCKSLENYDPLRGIEIGEMWLDECAYIKKEAWEVMLGRLRDKKGKLDALLTTTPKGFNWLYDYFHPSGEKYNAESFKTIQGKTHDNIYLPEGYINSLEEQYDSKLIQQELHGEFVNITTGRVYYAFNRETNVAEIKDDKTQTLYCGMDFNVNPMTAVIFQYYNKTFYAIDEFFLPDSNTATTARKISEKYGSSVKIIPDSTSHKRSTAGVSDFEILRQYFNEIMSTRNPYVIDRVNNMNRLFEQKRFVISPRCVKLINDLERVTWKDGKNELDQSKDKMLVHISDAAGYVCWKLEPMVRSVARVSIGGM